MQPKILRLAVGAIANCSIAATSSLTILAGTPSSNSKRETLERNLDGKAALSFAARSTDSVVRSFMQ